MTLKNNDFHIYKTKTKKLLFLLGEVFDAEPLLKSLYKKSDKKTFSKNFNREIKLILKSNYRNK